MYRIKEIMTSDVITVDAKDTLYEVATQMKKHCIGFLPVVDGMELVGVITDRDIVIKGMAEKLSDSTAVKDVMTSKCITVNPETPVEEAARIMSDHKIRRLCVVDRGELVGICAIGDIAVHNKLLFDAGAALSNISAPTRHQIMD